MRNSIIYSLLLGCLLLPMGCTNLKTVTPETVAVDIARDTANPKETTLWWLIILHDNNRAPVCHWVVKDDSVTFVQDSRSMIFVDPDTKEKILLQSNYSFTIIRMGTWYHPDFYPRERNYIPPKPKVAPRYQHI